MSNKFSIFLYLIIIFSFLQSWAVITFGVVVVFSFRNNPVFLIPLAILFDGYFGGFYTIPVLSLLSVIWFVIVESIKPTLANFNRI